MPAWMEVRVDRLRDVRGRFASVTNEAALVHARTHVDVAAGVLNRALRDEAPRGQPDPLGRPRRYPVLKENIFYRVLRTSRGWHVLFTGPPQVRFVLDGTRPHPIEGKRCPLHFYWHRVGREVWFWHVNHPGTTPNRFEIRAAAKVRQQVTTELQRATRMIAYQFVVQGPA